MQDADVPARTRRQAGLALGRLGWQPDDMDAFVEIPPGPFLYGDDERERRVISKRYWIGKYPVTNAQFARFVEDDGYRRREFWSEEGWAWRSSEGREGPVWWDDQKWNNPIFPVVGVSWFEAETYCKWMTARLKRGGGKLAVWSKGKRKALDLEPGSLTVRLPAEEEWERAARGTDGREYPWGDDFKARRANTEESNTERGYGIHTTAVCTYPQGASPEGVWDAAGNVLEWTVSRWGAETVGRVVRGGSWDLNQRLARCASRGWGFPDGYFLLGFRLVVSLALGSSES